MLRYQGFHNQLDQYNIDETLYVGNDTIIWKAYHKLSGLQVAIKNVKTTHCLLSSKQRNISEAHAMYLCQASIQVLGFVESFSLPDGQTYIVTKLARGGNLLNYMKHLGVE